MRTPVLIAARDEAGFIGKALAALPNDLVEPLVIANGCYDETAAIARNFGAATLELEQASKVHALQAGFRHLGKRALEPVLMMDADSHPLSSRWPTLMARKALEHTTIPVVVAGPHYWVHGHDHISDAVHSAKNYISQTTRRLRRQPSKIYGINMLIASRNENCLERLLAMDDYWPSEDRALRDVVITSGGLDHQVLNPLATVVSDASHLTSLWARLAHGGEYTSAAMEAHYASLAPEGSVPYSSPL